MRREGAVPGMTCSMSAQADELLATFARRLGAWRAWMLRADAVEVRGLVGVASGAPSRFVEVLGDTPVRVIDVRAVARECGRDTLLVVDSSRATSALCATCKLGANVCIESLDGTLGREGTGLLVVGVARYCPGRADVAARLDEFASQGAHAPRLWEPALVSGRLEGLDGRMRAASDLAQEMASFLACHPLVSLVRYPGLREDASYEAAASNLHNGFGTIVDFMPRGSGEWHRVNCLGHEGPLSLDDLVARLEQELTVP